MCTHRAATQYVPSELCYVDIKQKIHQKKMHAEWYLIPTCYCIIFHIKHIFVSICGKVFKYFLSSQVEIVMNSDPVLQVVTDNDLRGEQVYIYIFLTAAQDY